MVKFSAPAPIYSAGGVLEDAEGTNTAIVLSKGKSLSNGNVVGVITRERIADLIEQSVASYEE